jgi:hypothetical protein
MINETGDGLDVVIYAQTNQDWQGFATWYSIHKNLPQSRICFILERSKEFTFQYFQWLKKFNVKHFFVNPFKFESPVSELFAAKLAIEKKWVGSNIMVVKPLTMVIDLLNPEDVNGNFDFLYDGNVLLLKNQSSLSIENMINEISLDGKPTCKLSGNVITKEAREEKELSWLVSYQKGCGDWINTMSGCPFSSAGGHINENQTVNEAKIIELWQRMVFLYNIAS